MRRSERSVVVSSPRSVLLCCVVLCCVVFAVPPSPLHSLMELCVLHCLIGTQNHSSRFNCYWLSVFQLANNRVTTTAKLEGTTSATTTIDSITYTPRVPPFVLFACFWLFACMCKYACMYGCQCASANVCVCLCVVCLFEWILYKYRIKLGAAKSWRKNANESPIKSIFMIPSSAMRFLKNY